MTLKSKKSLTPKKNAAKDAKSCPNKENVEAEKFDKTAISPDTEKTKYVLGFLCGIGLGVIQWALRLPDSSQVPVQLCQTIDLQRN